MLLFDVAVENFPANSQRKKIKRGDTAYLTNGNVLALRYKDKKDVYFLSTLHRPKLTTSAKHGRDGNVILREQLVLDYNKNMGKVDKNDAIVVQHTMVRKSHKWTTKVAYHLLEEAIFNAHILYQHSVHQRLTFVDFKNNSSNRFLPRVQESKPTWKDLQ